jgi:DNA-binding transcriptional MerR regulator
VFRIGELSRIAQVSCRLLRYYDELGLLRPSYLDSTTGYRFYDASQLNRLNRILVFRDLGFSLAQIERLMSEDVPASELRAMLRIRQAELETEIAERAQNLEVVEQRILDLERGGIDPGEVVIRAEPACWVATHRAVYPSVDEARVTVRSLLGEVGGSPVELERLLVIQHTANFEPDNLDLEIGFIARFAGERPPVETLTLARRQLVLRELERRDRMATIVRVGPAESAHRQMAAIARQLESAGYVLDGPNRELFLRNPGPKAPPVVEMQVPIRPNDAKTSP